MPQPVWKPDVDNAIDFFDTWTPMSDATEYDNAFKTQWALFLKHVVFDEPFPWTFVEGAKNVLLAEKAIESWATRAWTDVHQCHSR